MATHFMEVYSNGTTTQTTRPNDVRFLDEYIGFTKKLSLSHTVAVWHITLKTKK